MTELDKITKAQEIIFKLARGINPLDDTDIPEDDLLNNINISRLLFEVYAALQSATEILDNKAICQDDGTRCFALTEEQIQKFVFNEEYLSVTKLVARLNELINQRKMKKIRYQDIYDFLETEKYLEVYIDERGRERRRPTLLGEEMGIKIELCMGSRGRYPIVLYSLKMQKYIVQNISSFMNKGKESLKTNDQVNKANFDKDKFNQAQLLHKDGVIAEEIALETGLSESDVLHILEDMEQIEFK